jgi:hypothetical protein
MIKTNLFSPSLELRNNLAIIGSGKKILSQRYGEKIDSYEYVIRFNAARVDEYKKFVGSKTTLRVLNNNSFECKKHSTHKEDCIFFSTLKNCKIAVISPFKFTKKDKSEHGNMLNNYYFCEGKIKKFLICFYFIKNFSIFFDLLKLVFKKNFSVGFFTILICVSSGIKPSIFGFDIKENMSERAYYWRDNYPIGNIHNLAEEHRIIEKLLKKDLIELF